MRVLIVDDETDIAESTAEILELDGFEVQFVTDFKLTLETMRSFRPDVVLHDARMPGMSLEQQFKDIRADRDVGNTPILIFTANMEGLNFEGQFGADGFIEKPFDPLTIGAKVAEFEGRQHGDGA